MSAPLLQIDGVSRKDLKVLLFNAAVCSWKEGGYYMCLAFRRAVWQYRDELRAAGADADGTVMGEAAKAALNQLLVDCGVSKDGNLAGLLTDEEYGQRVEYGHKDVPFSSVSREVRANILLMLSEAL